MSLFLGMVWKAESETETCPGVKAGKYTLDQRNDRAKAGSMGKGVFVTTTIQFRLHKQLFETNSFCYADKYALHPTKLRSQPGEHSHLGNSQERNAYNLRCSSLGSDLASPSRLVVRSFFPVDLWWLQGHLTPVRHRPQAGHKSRPTTCCLVGFGNG